MDCIFCKIIKGEIPAFKIYEDSDVLAFLDINPVTRGHALVIPKTHAQDIFDIEEAVLQKVAVVAKNISIKIKNVLNPDGIRLSQSNGQHAGQAIMHFHLHIIPRYQDDGVGMSETATTHPPQADMEELKEIAQKLM